LDKETNKERVQASVGTCVARIDQAVIISR